MKTAKTFDNKEVELTDMESQVIAFISGSDRYDDRPYAEFKDISNGTRIDAKKLRGVISSLDKKDVLYVANSFFEKKDKIVFIYNI